MSNGDGALCRALGQQIGTLQGLVQTLLEDRTEAARTRERIYNKLEEFKGHLDHRLTDMQVQMEERLASIEERVDHLEARRDQAAGVLWAARALWLGLGASLISAATWLGHRLGLNCSPATVLIALLVALATVAGAIVAFARDDGRYAGTDPALREWIRALKDRHGVSCCDTADGEEVEGWTMTARGYQVRVKGRWLDVPPSALLDHIPNRLGFARAWLYYENGQPRVRCFLPGAGG